MRLETGTYQVVSYDELQEANQKVRDAEVKFRDKHRDYLITCICDAGLIPDKKVRVKSTGCIGVLRVEPNTYSKTRPYVMRFYPIRKNGEVSKSIKYIPEFTVYNEEGMTAQLQKVFELVGEDSAG